jgi:hypothetical protein
MDLHIFLNEDGTYRVIGSIVVDGDNEDVLTLNVGYLAIDKASKEKADTI